MSQPAALDARTSVAGLDPNAVGVTPPTAPRRHGVFLTDVISELGFADPDAVQEAVDTARLTAKTPERCLLESGVIDERRLSIALAERNGLDHVDLAVFDVDPEAGGLISRPAATRYTALPIAFASDGALVVAIEDPCDMLGISDIEVMTKNEVRPVIATRTQIKELIERMPTSERPGPAPAPEPQPEPPVPRPEPEPEPPEPEPPTPEPEPRPVPVPEPTPEPEPEPYPEPELPEPAADGEISEMLMSLQDRMRQAGELAEATKRRIGEREGELEQARARIAELEQRLSGVAEAAKLARSASEKLTSLSSADD